MKKANPEEEMERAGHIEELNLLAAFRRLFSSEDGRLVLDDLLYKCGLYRRSFTGNAETYFREGQRDIGLYILDRLDKADLNSLEEMKTQSRRRLEEAHYQGLAALAAEVDSQLTDLEPGNGRWSAGQPQTPDKENHS